MLIDKALIQLKTKNNRKRSQTEAKQLTSKTFQSFPKIVSKITESNRIALPINNNCT
jgi:hypothetical protein